MRSCYNQLVKMNTAPSDFNTAVCRQMEPVHYDYALALRPWIEIFGKAALTVRPYLEDFRQDGGLYRDFLSVFGIDFDRPPRGGGWRLPADDVNPRLDDWILDLNRVLQAAGLSARVCRVIMRMLMIDTRMRIQIEVSFMRTAPVVGSSSPYPGPAWITTTALSWARFA